MTIESQLEKIATLLEQIAHNFATGPNTVGKRSRVTQAMSTRGPDDRTKGPETPSLDDLIRALQGLAQRTGGTSVPKELLAQYGVAKAADLPESKRMELITECENYNVG